MAEKASPEFYFKMESQLVSLCSWMVPMIAVTDGICGIIIRPSKHR